jgi:predicted transcriptional regulator
MTVMVRLHNKGILKRKLDETGAYIYTPVQDKRTFLERASKKAIKDLIREYGEVAVAQFIDAVESSNLKNLEEWRRKLKKIK